MNTEKNEREKDTMNLMLKIPKEFEGDFNETRFHECFERLFAELRHQTGDPCMIGDVLGNYEIGILTMMEKAFGEAEIIKDEQNLEMKQVSVLDKIKAEIENTEIKGYIRDVECYNAGINFALNIIAKYMTEEDKE